MLDATGKKLVRLLEADQPPEVRRAAALVLGEVGGRDAELSKALCAALDDDDPAVRLQAIDAAGKLKVEPALPQLLERVTEGGPESEAAALAAAKMGAKGAGALRDLMGKVAPGLRRRIAGALGSAGTSSAESNAVETLFDKDPGVVDAACRSLMSEIPSLAASHREALADQLLDLLKQAKEKKLPPVTEAAVVRILAALNDERAETFFWERIEPDHPPLIRATALQALGKQIGTPVKDKLKRLLTCAADRDFRVLAPALMLLKDVPATEKTLAEWLPLFQAPDPSVRRLVMEKAGGFDRADVVAGLLEQLNHRDRTLQDEALARLAKLEHGRTALADALLAADTPERAWIVARTQSPFVKDYSPQLRAKLFKEACDYLEAGDRRADPLLFVLREAAAREVRDQLEEKALALRKKKQYEKALLYLKLLGRDPSCGAAVRFELAAVGLRLSPRELSAEARATDHSLDQFGNLLHSHADELFGWVEAAKWLEPEDLFYLGFHFVEKGGPAQKFGGEVLRLLLKRSPRTNLAKDAKSKLRREGLE